MRIDTRNLNRASDVRASQNLPPQNIVVKRRSNRWIVGGVGALIFLVIATIIILKMGQPKTDYKMIVINELRAIHTAQTTYFSIANRYGYGNFDDLVKSGLLKESEGSYFVCKDCDAKELWYGKNKDYMFQMARNEAANGYCVLAIPRLDSDKAYAIGHSGVIFEDTKDKISCAGTSKMWVDQKQGVPVYTPDPYRGATPTKTVDFRTLPTIQPGR